MAKNSYGQFNEDMFKFLLVRFDKDENDVITMDEFCNSIFPSDFLSSNSA